MITDHDRVEGDALLRKGQRAVDVLVGRRMVEVDGDGNGRLLGKHEQGLCRREGMNRVKVRSGCSTRLRSRQCGEEEAAGYPTLRAPTAGAVPRHQPALDTGQAERSRDVLRPALPQKVSQTGKT